MIKPAGHQEQSTRKYLQEDNLLYKTVMRWLKAKYGDYGYAQVLVKNRGFSTPDLHQTLIDPRLRDYKHYDDLGFFASAVYNQSREPYVIYDLDTPEINHLAYEFKGLFVNTGAVGHSCGTFADIVFNMGTMDAFSVNTFVVETHPDITVSTNSSIGVKEEISKDLASYIKDVENAIRNGTLLQEYSDNPAKMIKKDIKRML